MTLRQSFGPISWRHNSGGTSHCAPEGDQLNFTGSYSGRHIVAIYLINEKAFFVFGNSQIVAGDAAIMQSLRRICCGGRATR